MKVAPSLEDSRATLPNRSEMINGVPTFLALCLTLGR